MSGILKIEYFEPGMSHVRCDNCGKEAVIQFQWTDEGRVLSCGNHITDPVPPWPKAA